MSTLQLSILCTELSSSFPELNPLLNETCLGFTLCVDASTTCYISSSHRSCGKCLLQPNYGCNQPTPAAGLDWCFLLGIHAEDTALRTFCPLSRLAAASRYTRHEHARGKLKRENWAAFGLSRCRLLEGASRSGSRAERAGGCLQPGWSTGCSSEPAGWDYTGMWCVLRAWKGHETQNSHSIICE